MTPRSGRALAGWAALACAVALAAGVRAGGIEDGGAGLQAMDRGAYDDAIRLFTKALAARDLSQDDRELAYLSRGKAYLAKGDSAHAVADLRQALALKPDDPEAQDALNQAQGPSAQPPQTEARWGPLTPMVGKYYWYQVTGQDPHSMVFHLDATTAPNALLLSVRAKNGVLQLDEYQYDEATHILMISGVSGQNQLYGTADLSGNALRGYLYVSNVAVQYAITPAADGSAVEQEQQLVKGAWQNTAQIQLVEVSEADLQQAGFLRKKH
jgi:tetratricopeptide (TPR) repeat protein